MAAVQLVSSSSHHGGFLDCFVDEQQLQFPDGLRVLVVDDDVACLTILNHMLKRCRYQVTTCCQATVALSLLRQRKGGFDVMISDVHMPDMDGYKLLEIVGLEMDLPVIMISADGRTSAVMKGIQHGACDYLIKPVRIEELQNIWQHVVRKKWLESKEVEHSGSFEDSTCCPEAVDEPEANASSTNDIRDDNRIYRKNKRDSKEDEELGNDSDASKKQRVAWSVELHQQFVNAINKLGVDKAVPKKILDLMNVPGLSRENVASHLQKFRLYLKRISSTSQHQNRHSNILFPPQKANKEIEFLDGYSFEAFGNSDQISPQTLAALNVDIVNKSSGETVLPARPVMPQPFPLTQRSVDKHNTQEVAYGLPILKCQPFNLSDFHERSNVSLVENSCFSTGPSKQHSIKGSTDILEEVKNDQNCNLLRQMLQLQGQYTSLQEPNHTFNVQPSQTIVYQPSTLFPDMPFPAKKNPAVISSQSSIGFGETKLFSTIQNFNNNNNLQYPDYSTSACVSNHILSSVHQLQGQALLTGGLSSTSMGLGSVSPSVPWSSTDTYSANILPPCNRPLEVDLSHSVPVSNIICNQGIENKRLTVPVKRQGESLGFVGKGTCISSRFALDDTEYPTYDITQSSTGIINNMVSVKQEVLLDFADSSAVEATWRMPFPSSD